MYKIPTLLFLMMLTVGASAPAAAHDEKGRYAIKGAGVTPCKHFVEQTEKKTKELYAYAGWVEGYLTGVNAYQKETFDITPWQNTKLLVLLLANYCKKNPSESFAGAVRSMVQVLYPQRLKTRSELVEARNGDRGIRIYQEVLKQVQKKLKERGLYKGAVDGDYGPATKKAILAFQEENSLSSSGLPDAATMMRLFFGNQAQEKK